MESTLIIASTEKHSSEFIRMLRTNSSSDIISVHSCGEGRRLLADRNFDLVIISSPLHDESGESLARQIALIGTSHVLLAVNSEIYEQVSSVCEKDGVLTITKPVNGDIFRQVLSLIKTMRWRLAKMQTENENLKTKIDNIRTVDRAKNILISSTGMSEHEAHRYIEKTAMDTRTSKRAVSEKIIRNYEYGE